MYCRRRSVGGQLLQRSRRVQDGYETYYTYKDLGNGAYEQIENQRPVYKTEY